MGLQPNIRKTKKFMLKACSHCGGSFGEEGFTPTKSIFYSDGVIPMCNECIDSLINNDDGNWAIVDKLCQLADVPFVPKEWVRLYDMNPVNCFKRYAEVFMSSEYEGIGWGDYFAAFRDLRE
jgi:hypothetical protein